MCNALAVWAPEMTKRSRAVVFNRIQFAKAGAFDCSSILNQLPPCTRSNGQLSFAETAGATFAFP